MTEKQPDFAQNVAKMGETLPQAPPGAARSRGGLWTRGRRWLYRRKQLLGGRIGGEMGTLQGLASFLLRQRRPAAFRFVEIGVFKGDTAVAVLGRARELVADVSYAGFDLFEDKDEFFSRHAEDRSKYDMPEYPYFEFQSGGHHLANVRNKIRTILPDTSFDLVRGDSTVTVPSHRDKLKNATLVYIDGCHDYDIVLQDWQNVRPALDANPETVVVFDDALYEGVGRLRSEIARSKDRYQVLPFNFNQFLVISRELRRKERWFLRLASWVVALREQITRPWNDDSDVDSTK
jgi:hypothetical protein